ncbi:MAG: TRZ/ATZ family hydrolase [Pseudomonadota bacterium]
MQHVKQILNPDWIVTVNNDHDVFKNHSLVIDNESIVDVLPAEKCHEKYTADEVLDLKDHALIPGLINLHTHAAMSLMRGLADDLPLQEWLEQHIWPTEAKHINRQFVFDGTLLAGAEMLKSGTTYFSDMYFFPDEVAKAAITLGVRANVGMIVIGFPTAWANSVDEYFSNGQRVHDQYRSHPLISTCFAPHAPYTVDDAALRRVSTLAEELDVPIHIHLHETQREVDDHEATHGVRPIARLNELGLISPRLIAVHMTALNEAEIALAAKHGVSVAHCPESNLKLASGFCPLQALLKHDINVGIGTDGAASNNDLDMLSEMRTAALLAKGVSNDACAVPATEALYLATRGAARALGKENQLGSLEIGKAADIVALDFSQVASKPLYDVVSQIVYAGHRDQVKHVWVAGKQVVDNHQLTLFDEQSIKFSAQQWQEKIAG